VDVQTVRELPTIVGEAAGVLFQTAHRDPKGGVPAGRTIAFDFIAARLEDLSPVERVEIAARIAGTVGVEPEAFRTDSIAHANTVDQITFALAETAIHGVLDAMADNEMVPREDGVWEVTADYLTQTDDTVDSMDRRSDRTAGVVIEYLVDEAAKRLADRTDPIPLYAIDDAIDDNRDLWRGSVTSEVKMIQWVNDEYDGDGSEYLEGEQVRKQTLGDPYWASPIKTGMTFHALRYAIKQELASEE